MEEQFWLDKWANNQIGFHEDVVHPLLKTYWAKTVAHLEQQRSVPELNNAQSKNVFVPLCGKSLDILWLRDHGHHVFGIELSEIAVDAFFVDNELAFEKSTAGTLCCYEAEDITLWCGDFFELRQQMLPPISLFYDRAALIALKPESRQRYMKHLASLLTDTARGLLITVEYDEGITKPPPHSIPPQVVFELIQGSFSYEPFAVHAAKVKSKPCVEHALLLNSEISSR